MGYQMDGIFQMYIGDAEYGAIEVAKKFDETKLLTDGINWQRPCISMISLYA